MFGAVRLGARPIGRVGVPACFLVAIGFAAFTAGPYDATLALLALRSVATTLGGPLVLGALQLFPDERPPRSAWARHGIWLVALRMPSDWSAGCGAPRDTAPKTSSTP